MGGATVGTLSSTYRWCGARPRLLAVSWFPTITAMKDADRSSASVQKHDRKKERKSRDLIKLFRSHPHDYSVVVICCRLGLRLLDLLARDAHLDVLPLVRPRYLERREAPPSAEFGRELDCRFEQESRVVVSPRVGRVLDRPERWAVGLAFPPISSSTAFPYFFFFIGSDQAGREREGGRKEKIGS